MKHKFTFISLAVLVIAACSTSKKSTTSATPATSANTTTVVATPTTVAEISSIPKAIRTNDGIYEPGSEELAAIQLKYKEVTIEKLREGYTLYAKSACISCHGAVPIYNYREDKWAFIIHDMAYRAKLTPDQKDAVHKYVLAIKATQPMPGMPK